MENSKAIDIWSTLKMFMLNVFIRCKLKSQCFHD